MNTDEHGLKRKFDSPSARKDTWQAGPLPGGLNQSAYTAPAAASRSGESGVSAKFCGKEN